LSKRKFVNKQYSPLARSETKSDETIKKGECMDIYFVRTEETLRLAHSNPVVSGEVTASALPDAWAVFCGLSDVIVLLEGLPLTVDAIPEGTISLNTNRS
jgi:nicotinate phosphoribosyltransferase